MSIVDMRHRNRATLNAIFGAPGRGTAAVVLLAALGSGCMRPLAVQDEYFSSTSRTIETANAEALRTLRHHRALQAAQHACPGGERSAPSPSGPDLGAPAAQAALAEVCASSVAPPRPAAAHGAATNAYRRWVEDRVRELPDPSETATSAGDG